MIRKWFPIIAFLLNFLFAAPILQPLPDHLRFLEVSARESVKKEDVTGWGPAIFGVNTIDLAHCLFCKGATYSGTNTHGGKAEKISPQSRPPTVLAETLSMYPIEEGHFWEYAFTDVTRDRDLAYTTKTTGKSTVKIVGIRDGTWGRFAQAEVATRYERVETNDPYKSQGPQSSVLSWFYIVLPGQVHEGGVFGEDAVRNSLNMGVKGMEGRGAPELVFPFSLGNSWGDKFYEYRVAEHGPINVLPLKGSDCAKIYKYQKPYYSNERETVKIGETWFCSGIGVMLSREETSKRSFEQVLVGYGPRNR
jgi:hypothetical protein